MFKSAAYFWGLPEVGDAGYAPRCHYSKMSSTRRTGNLLSGLLGS
jgi:hypothetical protein